MAYGWNTTAYQILNPGIDHWFSPNVPAVVGYKRCRNVFLVAGNPVCAPQALPSVVNNFEEFAREQSARVCYFCAADRLREMLSCSRDHSTVAIGAQPAWDPRGWPRLIGSRPSLRAQVSRARNRGVGVESIPPQEGRSDPEIAGVLDEWLKARFLPPLGFMVEPWALRGGVADRVLLVARLKGRVIAFLLASPVAARNGYLIEQVARSPRAPNGTSELLIDAAIRQFAWEGSTYVTLGLVALANSANHELRGNPLWLRVSMRLARAYANRFYNFQGLERFRTKMAPDAWETIYAISNERRFSVRTLYAIGEAFTGIPPWRAVGLALMKAVGQELRGLKRFAPLIGIPGGADAAGLRSRRGLIDRPRIARVRHADTDRRSQIGRDAVAGAAGQ
jgi:phosphatidylglycerol lysyltransferase